MKHWLLTLSLLVSLPVVAAGYRVVNPDGSIEFTDDPVPGAVPIDLPRAQTYDSPLKVDPKSKAKSQAPQQRSAVPNAEKPQAVKYKQVVVVSPKAQSTAPWDGGRVPVQVQTDPPLQTEFGHRIVLVLDGKPIPTKGESGSLELTGVYRGSHQLVATVRDKKGKVLASSAAVTFYAFQPIVR